MWGCLTCKLLSLLLLFVHFFALPSLLYSNCFLYLFVLFLYIVHYCILQLGPVLCQTLAPLKTVELPLSLGTSAVKVHLGTSAVAHQWDIVAVLWNIQRDLTINHSLSG